MIIKTMYTAMKFVTIFWEDERGGGAFESRKEAFQITSSLLGVIYVVVLILSFIYFIIFISEPDNSPRYGSQKHKDLASEQCAVKDGVLVGTKGWLKCMKREGYSPK